MKIPKTGRSRARSRRRDSARLRKAHSLPPIESRKPEPAKLPPRNSDAQQLQNDKRAGALRQRGIIAPQDGIASDAGDDGPREGGERQRARAPRANDRGARQWRIAAEAISAARIGSSNRELVNACGYESGSTSRRRRARLRRRSAREAARRKASARALQVRAEKDATSTRSERERTIACPDRPVDCHSLLHHDVDQLARHDDDLDDRLTASRGLHLLVSHCGIARASPRRRRRQRTTARNLPLIWTGISISSSRARASSYFGQGARSRLSCWPRSAPTAQRRGKERTARATGQGRAECLRVRRRRLRLWLMRVQPPSAC